MQMSGIDLSVYKAHSTSAASVSAAHMAHVGTYYEILNKAGWSSAQTLLCQEFGHFREQCISVWGGYFDTVM